MEVETLASAVTIHFSQDDGDSFEVVTAVNICQKCGKRTIVCPHRLPQQEIIKLPPGTTHVKIIPVQPGMRITVNPERNVRMLKLVEDVRFSLLETLTTLEEVWEDIGIKDEQKEQRNNTVSTHLQALLNEMLAEECDLKAKMEIRTAEYKKELEQLSNDLHIPPKQNPSDITLVDLEIKLRNDVNTLNKEKHDRLKWLRRLRAEEQMLCEQLIMPQHDINFVGTPTLEQLRELEQNVVFLKAEKNTRNATFEKLRREIISLWTEMDIEPENEFEKKLLQQDTSFTLSVQNLDTLNVIKTNLECERMELLQQIEDKRGQFKLLWGRLEQQQLDESEKVGFKLLPAENTTQTLRILNENIGHLHELKKRHMQKFIESIRIELVDLWDKCYFGDNQRKNFQAYNNNVYTEETLAEHEHQFNSMKQYYEDNKELLKLIGKREKIWEEKIKLESNPEDNLRFNNRGGALIKALKNKQLIEKQLPKLEKQLNSKIKCWECDNESIFMYNDCSYLDHMESQKQEYEVEQQIKKDEKRAKKQDLVEETRGCNKSSTKRKCGTPTMGSKYSRMDSPTKKYKQSGSKPVNQTHTVYRSPLPKRHKQQQSSTCNRPVYSLNKGKPVEKVTPNQSNTSKYTHSSLWSPYTDVQNENQTKTVKKKTIVTKLTTESRKKSMHRRSIRTSRILKDKNIENVGMNGINLNDDQGDANISLVSYNDFSSRVAEVPFSRSSFVFKPDGHSTDISVNELSDVN